MRLYIQELDTVAPHWYTIIKSHTSSSSHASPHSLPSGGGCRQRHAGGDDREGETGTTGGDSDVKPPSSSSSSANERAFELAQLFVKGSIGGIYACIV